MADTEGESPDFGELEPLGEELEPLGEELKPLGDELEPLGEELKPLGDELEPFGDELKPLGEELKPLGEELEPLGEELKPAGDELEPLGEELKPAGEELEPLGDELKPAGDELEPLGEELKPAGAELKPLGEEAGESALAGLEAAEFIPPDFESLLTSETVEPEAAEPFAPEAAAPTVEVAAEDAAAETAKAEEPAEEKPEEKPAEKETKAAGKLMAYLDLAIAGGIAAVLLVLALVGLLNFSTAIYAVSVTLVVYAIWKALPTNDLYTAMLGCALIAILTAVYCLWLEVGRYRFNVKAREAKQHVSAPGCRDPTLPHRPYGCHCWLVQQWRNTGGQATRGTHTVAMDYYVDRPLEALRAAGQWRDPGAEVISTGSGTVQQGGQIDRGLEATAAKQKLHEPRFRLVFHHFDVRFV